jgi:hypothetical protein
MQTEIRLNDHGLIARWRQEPERIEAALRTEFDLYGAIAEREVARHTPVGATGMLASSITHEVRGTGLSLYTRVFSEDLPVKVSAVEWGRRPGRMPPWGPGSALELWVRRKLGSGLHVAFLIARAIGRRGTRGQRMFERGARAARPLIEGRWRVFCLRIAGRL